jgi:hypothetical protein
MQPGSTTCTEDRIQHALERCLHGLSLGLRSTSRSGRSGEAGRQSRAQGSLRSHGRPGMKLMDSDSNPEYVTDQVPRPHLGRCPDVLYESLVCGSLLLPRLPCPPQARVRSIAPPKRHQACLETQLLFSKEEPGTDRQISSGLVSSSFHSPTLLLPED